MRLPLLLSVLAVPGLALAQEAGSAIPDAGIEKLHEQLANPVDVLPFGAGMTRPEQLRGEWPKYTQEALAARVEGTFILQCTILASGEVTHCRVIKSLMHMDTAILDAVKTWRFKPATLKGHPVSVRYTFTGQYTLPRKKR